MVENITMNVDNTLEMDYIVQQISDDAVEVKSEPTNNSYSINYLNRKVSVFNPMETGTYKLDINGQTIEIEVIDIPNSVVSRDPDNDSATGSVNIGVQIEPSNNWSKIQGEISANQSGQTRAYLYRDSDGQLMGDSDISSSTSGDVITVGLDTNLQSGTKYNFLVDAEGADFTRGYDSGANFPYTSSNGDLAIVTGSNDPQSTLDTSYAFIRVGNINL